MRHTQLFQDQVVFLTTKADTSKTNLRVKVTQLLKLQMPKMHVLPVVVNGMKKLELVKQQKQKKKKLVMLLVVNGMKKPVHVKQKMIQKMKLKKRKKHV